MARKKETLWSEQAHDTPAGHQAVPPEPLSVNPRRSAVILFSPRPASPASPRPPRTCESLPPFSPSPSHYRLPDSGTSFRRILIVLRSEEHTSELQSRRDLVCRLLLEK